MKDEVQLEVLKRIMQEMRQRDGESLKPKVADVEIEVEKPDAEPDGDEMTGPGLAVKDEVAPPADAGAPAADEMSDEDLEELVQMLQAKAAG
jgi:hypothetical protein